jgi:hypothetical protein
MQLTLTNEEARTLRELLHDHLPEIRRELAGTDIASRELKHALAQRQELCERLVAELTGAEGMAEVDSP